MIQDKVEHYLRVWLPHLNYFVAKDAIANHHHGKLQMSFVKVLMLGDVARLDSGTFDTRFSEQSLCAAAWNLPKSNVLSPN